MFLPPVYIEQNIYLFEKLISFYYISLGEMLPFENLLHSFGQATRMTVTPHETKLVLGTSNNNYSHDRKWLGGCIVSAYPECILVLDLVWIWRLSLTFCTADSYDSLQKEIVTFSINLEAYFSSLCSTLSSCALLL